MRFKEMRKGWLIEAFKILSISGPIKELFLAGRRRGGLMMKMRDW
jgi:hypothetical protein